MKKKCECWNLLSKGNKLICKDCGKKFAEVQDEDGIRLIHMKPTEKVTE